MRQSGLDGPDNAIEVLQHLVVPKAKDPEAEAIEFLGPLLIVLFGFRVMTAIQLHDQTSFQTDEVGNVGAEPKLPLELLP